MYLRLVHAHIAPDAIVGLQKVYDKFIIPSLRDTDGCLYIGLIVLEPEHNKGLSMTLWDSLENMKKYEEGNAYKENLDLARPYLQTTSIRRIPLSEDIKPEFVDVSEDISVKSYLSLAQMDTTMTKHNIALLNNLRILTLKIQPGKMAEFKKIYSSDILPSLSELEGCEYAFLTEGLEDRNEVISMTFWKDRTSMQQYEESGMFEELNKKVRHTYKGLYRWETTSEEESSINSDDLEIKYYTLLTGKKLTEDYN